MSRLFPDLLRVWLGPSAVRAEHWRGLLKKKRVEEKTLPCDPAFGPEPWHGAVAALKPPDFPCTVEVVLSNHFVRYAVIPWSRALAGAAEEEAYVRHHFAKVHGEKAKGWALRASPASAGAPRLASAIDSALLDAVRAAFPKGGKAKLVSVQPQLMSACNAWRQAIPASGAWLVLAEPDRACVALQATGGWRSVQNARGPWLTLLERERYRSQQADLPHLVLLAGARPPAEKGDWQFRELPA